MANNNGKIRITNLKLSKEYYGVRGAKDNLDWEFSEFLPKPPNVKEFFNLYHKHFYSIEKNPTHQYFLENSIKHAYSKGYINPRDIELNNLKDQIQSIKDQIDSIEKHHPFFKNGSFIMDESYFSNTQAKIEEGQFYYIQSSRKRQVLSSAVYYNLKNKTRFRLDQTNPEGTISNEKFIIYIGGDALNQIPNGPPIESSLDVYIPTLEINRYT